jgi:L-ascorbate metabolism protein UlaG (beta-lactamase superfamily)
MVISNDEIAHWAAAQGIAKTHGQHIGGGYNHPFGYVKLTIAQHGSALPDGSNGGNPSGFLITAKDGKKVYFACDTGLFYEMKFYGEEGLDAAFLPIGDNYTMGPDDALKAVKLLEPKVVVPVHYNTFPLLAQDAEAWAKRVSAETKTKPLILKPGESYEVP